jgi:DNA-binding beta-propeller fold protein YncE
MRRVSGFISILALYAIIAGAGCSVGSAGDSPQGNNPASSSSKEITTFVIVSPLGTGVIDESAKTVSVMVPSGTTVTNLVATFTTTGLKTTVGAVEQISGITPNNFTSPVVYTVTAQDGSTNNYTVTVTVRVLTPLNLTGKVTTLAGEARKFANLYDDGTGTAARLNTPHGVTSDGTNLYVMDTNNNQIRKIVIATGVVTTLEVSSSNFNYPYGIVIDNTGTNLYVADTQHHEIQKIVIATGVISTLAGSTARGHADGTGSAARFDWPMGITIDPSGTNLYVSDSRNNEIRKIVIATGVVTTLAGSTTKGHADGTGSAASFNCPYGITTDGTNLYVADADNHEIRKIVIATGVVTTLAGSTTSGHADGTGSAASFAYPKGIATDGANLYVADTYNNEIRKIVIATGVVTTLAGSTTSGHADGTGSAAGFYYPEGITTDGTNLYVTDSFNYTIRVIK